MMMTFCHGDFPAAQNHVTSRYSLLGSHTLVSFSLQKIIVNNNDNNNNNNNNNNTDDAMGCAYG